VRSWFAATTVAVVAAGSIALLPSIGASKPGRFVAVLTPGQIPGLPGPDSDAKGVAFGYLDAEQRFCFSISYDPPASDETQAHIHGPASAGRDAPLTWDLSDRAGSPRQRCVGPITRKQKKNLRAGLYYIVIHSAEYERGEIRGQILPTPGG